MIPSAYSSRYSGRQSTQNRSSTKVGSSSSASSSRPPPAQLGGGYTSRTTYLRETIEHESQLGHLLSPPSPPPSIEQILSAGLSNSGSQRPIPTSHSNSYQGLYDEIERELFAEPSSSSPQPDAGTIPTSLTSQESNLRYPGVTYHRAKGKWRVRWQDPTTGSLVSFSGFATQSEAIKKLEDYKESRGELLSQLHPGLQRKKNGKWTAKFCVQGKHIHVGTFDTQEEAARVLDERRAAYGLHAVSFRRNREGR